MEVTEMVFAKSCPKVEYYSTIYVIMSGVEHFDESHWQPGDVEK